MAVKELIYSQQSSDYVKGKAYSNPRFFTTARSDVEKVFVVGDWPAIHQAYEAMGIEVVRLDKPPEAPVERPALPPALVGPDDLEARAQVVIPENWRDLGWTKAIDGGVSLRALATSVSSTPILNKGDAAAAIEAELARRAACDQQPAV